MPYTSRQLENFETYRLGGGSAVSSLRGLLYKFIDFDGNLLLIIHDQEGNTIGLAFQTKAQRALFEEWGDNLILDWTHNTNNANYYLGSLLATSVSGTGVSVYDFLCLSQSVDMMRTLFEHFVSINPGAIDRVKSFVIDKDYREWRVLEEVFHKSVVVLCQFHVLKWFKSVIRQAKYNIPEHLRDEVFECLQNMVYAPSESDFDHQKHKLHDLLSAKEHNVFLDYLQVRWYDCVQMWANFRRGNIFTAMNTTSNRLEAFWRQLKELLDKRQRIDFCVAAIFLHATGVLTREKDALIKPIASMPLHFDCPPYLRSVLRDLGEFTVLHVRKQWVKYAGSSQPYQFVSSLSPTTHVIRVTNRRTVDFTITVVGVVSWSCTCRFYMASWLPCRHLMFYGDQVLKLSQYPVSSLAPRWSMSRARLLIPTLLRGIDNLMTLRVDLLDGNSFPDCDASTNAISGNESTDPTTESSATWMGGQRAGVMPLEDHGSIALVKLRRREISKSVVLSSLEKRNIVRTLCDEAIEYLMAQGTERFRCNVVEFASVLEGLVKKWKEESAANEGTPTTECVDISHVRQCEEPVAYNAVGDQATQSRPHRDSMPATALDNDLDASANSDMRADGWADTDGCTDDDGWADPDRWADPDVWVGADTNFEDDEPLFEEDLPSLKGDHECPTTAADEWRQVHGYSSIAVDELFSNDAPGDDSYEQSLQHCENQEIVRSQFVRSSSFLDTIMMELEDSDVTHSVSTTPMPAVTEHLWKNGTVTVDTTVDSEVATAIGASSNASNVETTEGNVDPIGQIKIHTVTASGTTHKSSFSSAASLRYHLVDLPTPCPVQTKAFVLVMQHCLLSRAHPMSTKFPYYLDDEVLKVRMPTTVEEYINPDGRDMNFAVTEDTLEKFRAMLPSLPTQIVDLAGGTAQRPGKQVVVRLTSQTCAFTRYEVHILGEFNMAKKQLREFHQDLEWLSSASYWIEESVSQLVTFLADDAARLEGEDTCNTVQMREAIKSALESSSLHTTLSLPSCGLGSVWRRRL